MFSKKFLFTLIIFFVCLYGNTKLEIVKSTRQIKIDGRIDEEEWGIAPKYSNLETFEPEYGKPLSSETNVYTSYDSENLYFAFECKSQDPDKIQGTLTQRDNVFNEDCAIVLIDSYNDRQNAYCFFVNSMGVQGDLMLNHQGNGDASQDFVWNSAAKKNGQGYNVEIAVPLKSIRFKPGRKVNMGIGFGRQITSASEKGLFPGIDPDKGGMLAQLAIAEFENLSYVRNYEILPSLTRNQKMSNTNGNLKKDFTRNNFGITTKVGLTPTLTLDATYNPDFSQVEADAGQVTTNLRSNIYYSEKRPFFMEGIEKYATAGTGSQSGVRTTVHTRNIIDPVGGLKLSGKIGQKNSISTLIAADESPRYNEDGVNSNAYFGILRYKKLLNQSNYLGAIYTSRFLENGYNQVGGFDSRYRLNGKMSLEGNVLYSLDKQRDMNQVNSAYNADIEYTYSDKKYYFNLGLHDISKNFKMASGFVPRDGVRTITAIEARSFYLDNGFLKKIKPSSYSYLQYDKYDRQTEYYANLANDLFLPGNTFINCYGQIGTESFAGKLFRKNGYGIFIRSQFIKQLEFVTSIYHRGTPWYDEDDPFQAEVNGVYAELQLKPTGSLKTSFRFIRSLFHKRSTGEELVDYKIYRNRTTYQINKYLFIRTTLEYNAYEKELLTDLLMSFTYIPGTVVHLGYGSLYEKTRYRKSEYIDANDFMEMERGLFIKASYNWRI
jgi:hypothetical protein